MSNLPARPPLRTGGALTAIVPQSIEEAYRLADAVVKAGMAPKSVNTSEKAMVAILHGMEVGLTPMAALQSIAVVNGMPTIWGDGALALVRGSDLCGGISEWIEGDGDKMVAHCDVIRRGELEPIHRTFSMDDAKRAGLLSKDGPWKQYPKRMLQMRARAWALRDGFADVLRGLRISEEVGDYTEVRNVDSGGPGLRQRLQEARSEAPAPAGFLTTHAPSEEVVDAETGEVTEAAPEVATEAGEAVEEEPVARVPSHVFTQYHQALVRFSDEASLKKAAAAFWSERDGWPLPHPGDMDIAKKVFAAHTNRVTGKLSPEDVAAHVTELVEELA